MAQIDITQTEWNFKELFAGDNDPSMEKERKEIEKANHKFIEKWRMDEKYLKDPKVLKEALDEFEVLQRQFGNGGKQGYYFWLRSSQDQSNTDIKAKVNKIEEFSTHIYNAIQFFTLNIAKIPAADQSKFLGYEDLRPYKHFLEKLFAESKYLLSEEEEKIIVLKAQTSHSNWTRMVSEFLAKEEREIFVDKNKKEKKNFSEIQSMTSNKEKVVRDDAAKAVNEIVGKHAKVAEAEINSILGNKKVDDDLRGIARPDLTRHIGDDIDTDVVDTLIKTVSSRFNISQRYYALKAKLLGFDKMAYHERNVDYGKVDKKFTFQDSADLVYKTMNNLDPKFAEIFKMFVTKGQVDVYPRKGKRGGAFCAYNLISQPVYTLLNHTDKFNDVLTIAHELGHGINDELMREKQNALNFGTPMSTAEVASTFMEDFVLQELLSQSNDDEFRLTVLMQKLNDDISTIIRQVAGYKFEQDLHQNFREKGYLSAEDIGKIFQENMSAYMGPAVEQSDGSENWWVQWPHIRSFFYVYSYSSGLLISKAMQNSVKSDPKFIEKVKEFLSAGLSDSPKNIFAKMNIDITYAGFWNKGLDEVEKLLDEVEGLAKKLGKII
jgi:oligoendopeptidase F